MIRAFMSCYRPSTGVKYVTMQVKPREGIFIKTYSGSSGGFFKARNTQLANIKKRMKYSKYMFVESKMQNFLIGFLCPNKYKDFVLLKRRTSNFPCRLTRTRNVSSFCAPFSFVLFTSVFGLRLFFSIAMSKPTIASQNLDKSEEFYYRHFIMGIS